ncbi:Gas vesicle synthesis protein GvpL/GvpF [Gracilibacillus ureilyticus]|uniref:Gas vesicle synthesis protein GvpL/GvpF n=1 Tax=Gracilibacillus ureilyticus TaxID=531814 RepID=A0A1H9PA48_9BACI|nr:GvpL/GvpF family gas vesicle protein [Gracilibacillus ureilyticus]SER45072.1 Gas vesicle synthesis protein GvpL/GvpF [Gracilibacillus ureilyticus]
MTVEQEKGIYIFCGIQTNEQDEFGRIMLDGNERSVFTIHYKDAAMVAAEVPMKIYHPNKENLMMHQQLVSKVMAENDTVIPISFGNVFHSVEDVEVLLENLYPQLKKLFPAIKGKMELGLKIIGKTDWLKSQVYANEKVEMLSGKLRGKTEMAGYYDRIQLGGATQEIFSSIINEIEQDVYTPLEESAEAAKVNEPVGEKMLLNASFLVDREKESEFDRLVNMAHEKWKDKVDFKYSGPWPAYNFVNIRLTVEES